MTIKKTTVLMAAVLAVATVLAAGLVAFPGSIQEAQANPCSNNQDNDDGSGGNNLNPQDEQECTLIGNFEDAFEED